MQGAGAGRQLRDFAYDAELLGREEIEDRASIGLTGVVKVSYTVVSDRSLLNLDAFAPLRLGWGWVRSQYLITLPNNKDEARKAAS